MNPRVQTPQELTDTLEDQARAAEGAISLAEEEMPFVYRLSARIKEDWVRNLTDKRTVEHNALECLRERKGEYGPDELRLIQAQGGSDIYIREATAKIRAAIAHIESIYLPASGAAHGVEPTPNAELPGFMQDRIVERIVSNPNMVDDQGQPVAIDQQTNMLEQMAKREFQAFAQNAARRMEKKINDQLTEGGYQKALKQFISDFCTMPAAFMRGPYWVMQPKLKWELNADGAAPRQTIERTLAFRTINFFDAYPGAGSDSTQRGAFVERLRMTKKELYRMRTMPGYNAEAITEVMLDSANERLDNWLWTDAAQDALADHNLFWYRSNTDLDGLHWYGSAQGSELIEWGMDPKLIDDPLDYYEVDAILIGRHVVRASINPDLLYRRPIHSASYEPIAGSPYGHPPSQLMRSTGRMINATGRALQNNLALSSGPQMEVNHKRLAPQTPAHTSFPGKIWSTEESEVSTNGAPAVRWFQPDSNVPDLLSVIGYFRNMADTDTGIPEIMQGGGPTDAVARVTSMLRDSGTKLLRSAMGNIDSGMIVPVLEMLYDHNMLHDPDPSIKGDSRVVAKGANKLLQRESERQAVLAALDLTNNPEDRVLVGDKGRATLIRGAMNTLESIDPDSIIPQGEELDTRLAELAQAAAAPPPPDPAMAKVEADAAANEARMAMEQQGNAARMELEERLAAESRAAERILKEMELAARGEIADRELQATIERETKQLRADRMGTREKSMMDAQLAKMKIEADARMRVAEMRAMEKPPTDDGRETITSEDIAKLVEKAIRPLEASIRGEQKALLQGLTAKLSGEQGVTVNMVSGTKKISTTRDKDGNLSATVTPEK